jgi:hypothetical protein
MLLGFVRGRTLSVSSQPVSSEPGLMGAFGTDVMLLCGASVEVVWHKSLSFDFLTKVVVWLSLIRGTKNKSRIKGEHKGL